MLEYFGVSCDVLPIAIARIKKNQASNWPIHLKSESILYLFPCHTGRLYKRLRDIEWKQARADPPLITIVLYYKSHSYFKGDSTRGGFERRKTNLMSTDSFIGDTSFLK